MQRTRIYEHPEADGSRTMVIHDSAPREARSADAGGTNISGDNNADLRNEDDAQRLVLSLHGGGQVKRKKHGQRVVWKDDVVDNEGAGKKKSKICCIYHKPRKFDESSSESDSDSECSNHDHQHSASSADPSSSNATANASTTATIIMHEKVERNAYEVQPHHHHPRNK